MAEDRIFSNVLFEFVKASDRRPEESVVSAMNGTVRILGDFMILAIPAVRKMGPYLLKGFRSGDSYSATNTESQPIDARARWAGIGNGEFVGLWVEDGYDYFFKFRLAAPN